MSRFTAPLFALMLLATPVLAARLAPEDEIARTLAGRVAGRPTDCIYQRDIRSSRIVDGTAIIYEMNDGTIFLNRPPSGAGFLRSDLALVTKTFSDQLCSVDIVRLYDTASRFETGSVGLGPFVPYRRPDSRR